MLPLPQWNLKKQQSFAKSAELFGQGLSNFLTWCLPVSLLKKNASAISYYASRKHTDLQSQFRNPRVMVGCVFRLIEITNKR